MDLQAYKKRLVSSSEITSRQVKRLFKNSPAYQEIILNGETVGVRVSVKSSISKKSAERELLLQPDEVTNIGAVASFEGSEWLVQDFIPSRIYPKAIVAMCNQTITIKNQVYPCIADGKRYTLQDEGKIVTMPEGELVIQLPYDDTTQTIKENDRFNFGTRTYEVKGIDDISRVYKGVGILEVTVEVTSSSIADNDANTLASGNSDGSSGWGGGW